MGTRQSDIIARLTLNAESFSATHGEAFKRFTDSAKKAGTDAKLSLSTALADVAATAKQALTLPDIGGKLDLNVSGLRARADAAKNEAAALREVADAANRAALAQDHLSDEAVAYAQASAILATRAEENATALDRQANALDRVQGEMAQTTRSGVVLHGQQQRLEASAKSNQYALRSLGQQWIDVGASAVSGGNFFVIFGQQIGQVGYALSDMTGKAGALGRFLTNPWVAALTTAGIIVGVFASKLNETSEALDKTKFAAGELGSAQSILGTAMDLTTGKIKDQSKELAALALAQLKVAEIQARTKADQARTEIAELQKSTTEFSGGIGGGFSVERRPAGARGVIAQQVLDGTMDASTAVERLDNLRKVGVLTDVAFADAAASVTALGTNLRNLKDYESAERLLKGIGTAADRSRVLTPKKGRDNSKATAALGEFGRDADDRIANIVSPFMGEPTAYAKAAKAIREINDLIDDLQRKRPPDFKETIASAEQAKVVIQESIDRPFRDLVQRAQEREQVEMLVLRGQYDQADALQTILGLQRQMGPLSDQQKAKVLEIAKAEEARARAIEDQRRQVGLYVQAVGDVQRSFEDLLSGGSVKDLGKKLLAGFRQLNVRLLSEKLFGGLDRKIEDLVSGRTGLKAATDYLGERSTSAGNALGHFVAVVDGAAQSLSSVVIGQRGAAGITTFGSNPLKPLGDPAAELKDLAVSLFSEMSDDLARARGDVPVQGNDDIVVTGKRQVSAANDNTRALIGAVEVFNHLGGALTSSTDKLGSLGKIIQVLGKNMGTILQGGAYGGVGAALAGSVIGGRQSGLGGAIGGAVAGKLFDKDGVLGKGLAKGLDSVFKGLGQFAGPLAGIAGGVIGSVIGGLFSKTKKASSTLSVSNGSVIAGEAVGNNGTYRNNANQLGGSVGDSLNSIAEALGGDLGGSLSVSIGQRKKKFVVDTTGRGRTKGSGVLSFASEQEAVEAAIKDALSDGVIKGISSASQRILQSGQDLSKAIEKATLIESIPKLLKQRLDPVGYAIDEVNSRFEKIIATLQEGGASADQMAQAQQLYNLELADAKASAAAASDSLKAFLASINAGSASPYSLKDQESSARSVLDPYLGQISRGETIDQEKYLAAAQSFLDIERQLYGSTSKYFEELGKIQAATNSAIGQIDNATPIKTTSDPFIEATAAASKSTAASTANLETLMAQNNALMARLIELTGTNADSWINQVRGFA